MAQVGFVKNVQAIGVDSLKAGAVGGVACGIGGSFGGPIGAIIGAVLAGAALDGQNGRIVVINGVQDTMTASIIGAMRSVSNMNWAEDLKIAIFGIGKCHNGKKLKSMMMRFNERKTEILKLLEAGEELTASEVSQRLGIARINTSRLMGLYYREGLLGRRVVNKFGELSYRITDRGRRRLRWILGGSR